jgi:FkbM family methyltransferase
LRLATDKDPNIFCYQLALVNQDGQEEIVTQGTVGNNSLRIKANSSLSLSKEQTVELFTLSKLDSFIENAQLNFKQINILKIDTEGFEIAVLQGAEATLRAGKIRYIFSETTLRDQDKTHSNFSELKKFLETYNFHPVGFYDIVPYWGGGNAIDYCNVLFKFWENKS